MGRPAVEAPAEALLGPIFTLVGLTFAALVLAAVVRNVAVARGRASVRYYETYREGAPEGGIERPAKTYDNLLQIPTLFYLVCVLMIVTGRCDSTQVALAWLFVGTPALSTRSSTLLVTSLLTVLLPFCRACSP